MPYARHARAIALIAASTLVYEVLLTRVAALRLAFHYGFLIVANALLAIGAAGALLYLLRKRIEGREQAWLTGLTVTYALSLPLTYAFLLLYPAPYDVSVTTGANLASFAFYNLGAALPFLFAGGVIGLLLTTHAARVHQLYAADLIGAAVGCVLCPLILWTSGAGGALGVALALAVFALREFVETKRLAIGLLGLGLLAVEGRLDALFPVPSKTKLELTENVSFIAGDRMIESRWSAISRVDLANVPEAERNLFMRGENVEMPRPERQAFLMQDGSAGTYVHDYSTTPEALEALERTLYSLGVRVLQPESMFVIGIGGGDDLWAGKHGGVQRIKGIELNRQILNVHHDTLFDYSRDLVEDPNVELVHGEGRSMLLREEQDWDLFQMSGIDTWTALQSGAYVLAENYLYTQDAVDDIFRILGEHGAVQVTRFSGDHEALRLLATLRSAHERFGEGRFAECVICVPAGTFLSILCKRTPFMPAELARLDEFLEDAGLPVVHHPARGLGGAVEKYVRMRPDLAAEAITNQRVDIRPVTDDRPYFFHFHRWNDLGAAHETLDAEVTVTQGNPLFLLGQLGLALVAALVLLGVPLAVRGGGGALPILPTLSYFAALGAGFIALQVALLQKLVLLVGHPVYSVTVTLASMLLATGFGAYLSRNRFAQPTGAIWLVPVGLALWLGGFSAIDQEFVRAAVQLPTPLRFAAAALIVFPVGILVGIPFAHGLSLVQRSEPSLVPWAWAANAASTVVGSLATVVLSMNFGFRAVFLCGVLLYVLVALSARSLRPRAVA